MEGKLEKLRAELKHKQATQDDFKARYNIDFDILLNPEHPQFTEKYQVADDANENMLTMIKIKNA